MMFLRNFLMIVMRICYSLSNTYRCWVSKLDGYDIFKIRRIISCLASLPTIRSVVNEYTSAAESRLLADMAIIENIHGMICSDAHGTIFSFGTAGFILSRILSQSLKHLAKP
jgi:hypothetical protein